MLAQNLKSLYAQLNPLAHRQITNPRFLLYSHDTFGLGNIRRTLLLAQELIDQYPKAAVLLITGSLYLLGQLRNNGLV